MEDPLINSNSTAPSNSEKKNNDYPVKHVPSIKSKFTCTPETQRIIVISLISFSQGISGLPDLAIQYIYKDVFGLSPATVSSLISFTYIPWFLKLFYGFISDSFPIFGYRRKPYLVIFTFVNIASLFGLAFIQFNIYFFVSLIVLYQIASAFINMLAEALIIETSRKQAKKGQNKTAHNVFLFFFIRSFGYLLTSFCSGALIEVLDIKFIFILTTVFPILILIAACTLNEKKVNILKQKKGLNMTKEKLSQIYRNLNISPLEEKKINKNITLKGQFILLKEMIKQPNFCKTAIYTLIYSLTPGYSTVLFFFYTNDLGFSPIQMGNIKMIYGIAVIIGMIIFRLFLQKVQFKKIMMISICLDILFNLNMILLIKHINRSLNIPDIVYVLISESFLNSTSEIMTMPLLILVCNVCPKNVEGTLYALFMGIMNLGYFIAAQGGALIVKLLGVSEKNFTNLPICVIITCAFLVLTFFFSLIINDKKYHNPFQDEHQDYLKKRVLSLDKFDINDTNHLETKDEENNLLNKPKRKTSSHSL